MLLCTSCILDTMIKKDKRLQAAKKFILSKGGIEEVSMFTKVMLSLTGQFKWPRFSPLPIEIILLPLHFPINFYSFSVYGRANLTPMMILADKKFTLKTGRSPDLSDLFVSRNHPDTWIRSDEMRSLVFLYRRRDKGFDGVAPAAS